VPGAITYQLRITDSTTRSNLFPGTAVASTSWSPPRDLIPGHAYRVSVRPNLPYRDGPWSEPRDFAVAIPQVTAPGTRVTALRPRVSWSAVPGVTAYDVRLDDLTGARVNLFPGTRVSGTEWTPPADLVSGRTYRVIVRAVNALNQGLWGPAATFAVATPTLNSPAGDITVLRPSFSWSAIDGASRYTIAIDDLTTGRRAYLDSTTQTSWSSPNDLVIGHRYRWRVIALNANGLGRWSAAADFRVVN
jgi:hypothetical protein